MDISSKISLYDVLAMIIPGGILMLGIALILDISCIKFCYGCIFIVEKDITLTQALLLLIGAYIIGLINNCYNDVIFNKFRNNYIAIANELNKVLNSANINLNIFIGYDFRSFLGETITLRRVSWKIAKNIFGLEASKTISEDYIILCYNKAYYRLIEKNLIGNIPYIEAQVALLRNSLLPIFIFILVFFSKLFLTNISCLNIVILSLLSILISGLIIIILFIVMVHRQDKVYHIIWELVNYYEL